MLGFRAKLAVKLLVIYFALAVAHYLLVDYGEGQPLVGSLFVAMKTLLLMLCFSVFVTRYMKDWAWVSNKWLLLPKRAEQSWFSAVLHNFLWFVAFLLAFWAILFFMDWLEPILASWLTEVRLFN